MITPTDFIKTPNIKGMKFKFVASGGLLIHHGSITFFVEQPAEGALYNVCWFCNQATAWKTTSARSFPLVAEVVQKVVADALEQTTTGEQKP